MDTIILDGQHVSQVIKDQLKSEVADLVANGITPTLAVVIIGDDPASQVYVRNKKLACEYVGIKSLAYELPGYISEDVLLNLIHELNNNDEVHGILVQLPLPDQINEQRVIEAILPQKDVDGFHPKNVGALYAGLPGIVPCTPAGIIEFFEYYNIATKGKHCVVVGRSNVVGKPIAQLMLNEHATVSICHSLTENLESYLQMADIVIVAIGKPKFIKGTMIKKGAVVIDVGMNRDENGKLCGDVDYGSCLGHAKFITPVPKGVGPMTIAMLLKNCIRVCVDDVHMQAYELPNRNIVNSSEWRELCTKANICSTYATPNGASDFNGFENDTFVIRAYSWKEPEHPLPNFHHKPSGFKLWWYKYAFRSSHMNKKLSEEQINKLFKDCTESIQKPKQGE